MQKYWLMNFEKVMHTVHLFVECQIFSPAPELLPSETDPGA